MSTQRLGVDDIIASDRPGGGTLRNSTTVISSIAPQPVHIQQVLSSSIGDELFLNGIKYSIVRQIARSGEAEVFLVNNNGNNFVFKYYYSQFKPKDEILKKLKALRHPYIIALFDFGYYKERFFEVSEYAQGGTLTGNMPLNTLQKTKEIVAQTIEGLNYCHTLGIIHRDIKPENIFYRTPQKKEIAIGDFGIASNLKDGEELVRTTMARTSLYAAPELFTNIQGKTTIEKSVDYYALGMSLLHLWFGRDPFEDVDEFGIMRLKSEGRVLFPDNISADVEKLIKGLITVNPRERWGYDEAKSWLRGDDVKVFYQTVQFDYKPYAFGFVDGEQIVVNNPKDLISYLEKYPDKGEGHLYRNSIAKWVEPVDPGLFNDLMDIVERDYPTDRAAGLTKAIYILDQERPFRGMDNTKLRTQEEIAAHFEQHFKHYKEDLQNPNAAFYIFLESRNYKENADEYRNYFTLTNPEAALNTLIFKLEGADKFIIGNYTIYQPEELLQVDKPTMEMILKQLSDSNSKLSIWINSFPKLQPTLEKWHILKKFDEITLRYALQQGFSFNGSVAPTAQDFYMVLKSNFHAFFPDNGDSQSRDEASYWLKNYMDSSFCKATIDYLCSENYTDKEFIQLLEYALSHYDETEVGFFPLIEFLLPYIKNKKTDNKKGGNKILLTNVVDIFSENVGKYWDKEVHSAAILFIDLMKDYVAFIEKNTLTYPELCDQLTIQLSGKIRSSVVTDINLIKGDEQRAHGYRDDLGKLLERIKLLNIDIPYYTRYNKENTYLNKFRQSINLNNISEKREKIKITNQQFDKQLHKYRSKYKSTARFDINEKLWWYISFAFLGVVLLLAVFIYGDETPITVLSLGAIALGALLGSRIGNLIGVRVAGTIDEKNQVGAIIGMYGGMLLTYHFKSYIPYDKGLDAFGLYNAIPMPLLYLGALLMLAVFGTMAWLLMKKIKDETKAIELKPEEQAALSQNMIEIEKYYNDKESFDTFQELLRLVALDDQQFDKEFSKIKSPV